jgi:hypothetical protein
MSEIICSFLVCVFGDFHITLPSTYVSGLEAREYGRSDPLR